jgi:peptidoglycan-associated lipoprotein
MNLVKLFSALIVLMSFTGCTRSSEDVWDDTKTASRHMQQGIKSFCGVQDHSRPVHRREDFLCSDGTYSSEGNSYGQSSGQSSGSDFISLPDDPSPQGKMANISPGDPGSPVPGIEAFHDPKNNPELAGIFKNIYFPHNSSLLKGTENMDTVRAIGEYAKTHPNMYLFVEGHCDERGAEAYNFSLGLQRSNIVAESLIKHGVNPQNIFTVSYGKERPVVQGNDEDTWSMNRRAEFKVYWQ